MAAAPPRLAKRRARVQLSGMWVRRPDFESLIVGIRATGTSSVPVSAEMTPRPRPETYRKARLPPPIVHGDGRRDWIARLTPPGRLTQQPPRGVAIPTVRSTLEIIAAQQADREDDATAPVGSPEWRAYVRASLSRARRRLHESAISLQQQLRAFQQAESYRQLRNHDGQQFTSWAQYVEAPEPWGLAMRADLAQAIIDADDDMALLLAVVAHAAENKRNPIRLPPRSVTKQRRIAL